MGQEWLQVWTVRKLFLSQFECVPGVAVNAALVITNSPVQRLQKISYSKREY